jgi:phytoene synthase
MPFWMGALAVQMVHEASLLHDDILDDASVRRSQRTVVSEKGLGAALVLGDLYLTGAYRAASQARDPVFLGHFIEAVERTVAGEMAQEAGSGRVLSPEEYGAIIRGKSGELFGAAAALAATFSGADAGSAREVGLEIGALYQMVDDFLDYCPDAHTGKPPFQDYRQRKYTFVLREAGLQSFDPSFEEIHTELLTPGPDGLTGLDRALAALETQRRRVLERCASTFGCGDALETIVDGWLTAARRALATENAHLPQEEGSGGVAVVPREDAVAFVADAARAVGGPGDWGTYFGHHSKSFQFSARLFPSESRADIEGVYAFCRFTDDLVDEAKVSPPLVRERLEAWRGLAHAAYHGESVGVPLLDTVMGRMAEAGSPFHYADDLITGVGMDLEPVAFRTLADLEVYTYRVASVVGGWITELFGLHDRELLSRAYALGHAMQLTNILRDVGEDWRRGRVYLPTRLLEDHGVEEDHLRAMAETGTVPRRWPELMERLMAVADRQYALAFEAIPALPAFYRRPVAVAARVYQGIHDEIRRNGYNNGTLRAHTSFPRKLRLGAGGLWALRGMSPEPLTDAELALAHQDPRLHA